jgi:hypothetical protein
VAVFIVTLFSHILRGFARRGKGFFRGKFDGFGGIFGVR